MTMLRHDEAALVCDLGRLGNDSRVAFAAACAERLLPAYKEFCRRAGRGSRDALAGILEKVWLHLQGDKMSTEQIRAELDRCMSFIPGEDEEPWVDEQPYADDAASAVAYALRALESGQPAEAGWAARRAYDTADHHVMYRLGVEGDSHVLAHPIVQAELARQRRDLEELLGAGQESALFVRLRDRARAEGSEFFASAS